MIKAGDTDNYPQASQSVAVHYDAYLPDGKMWDSSRKRGRPLRFRLGAGQVIPGLDNAAMLLSLGMRARVTIPAELAFATHARPGQSQELYNEQILIPALGDTEHRDRNLLLRLFYEAFAVASAEIRRLQDPSAPDAPLRRLTHAYRVRP